MKLKLVPGAQFSNPLGEILVSIPDILEKTIITKWQYRMLLSLDGSQAFIDVVKEVKTDCEGEFEAADIWMFLDWLIESHLVTSAELVEETADFDANPTLPRMIAPKTPSHSWVRVPLQVIAVLLLCAATIVGAYVATPFVLSGFIDQPEHEEPELASIQVADPELTTEIVAVRIPTVAEPKEITVAAAVVPAPVEMELMPEEPSLVEKLISMRREMAACQIRRDEYYLLNDEDGYSDEVARISELVKEIGQIRADISI